MCEFLEGLDLPEKSVILLDNVSFHHSRSVYNIASKRSWDLLFVPPYSPWFNPIEGIFSIIKRHYYENGDINEAFKAVKASHCKAFFDKALSI